MATVWSVLDRAKSVDEDDLGKCGTGDKQGSDQQESMLHKNRLVWLMFFPLNFWRASLQRSSSGGA